MRKVAYLELLGDGMSGTTGRKCRKAQSTKSLNPGQNGQAGCNPNCCTPTHVCGTNHLDLDWDAFCSSQRVREGGVMDGEYNFCRNSSRFAHTCLRDELPVFRVGCILQQSRGFEKEA